MVGGLAVLAGAPPGGAPRAVGVPAQLVAGAAGAADADDSMVMVLDSSGSMAGPDGSGGTRIGAAKRALDTVIDDLPDGFRTGLRVYGATREKGCTDTQLSVPVAPLDRPALKRAAAAVEPKGDTPIGYSLRKAATDLPDHGRRTILLVSDGEDTCGGAPPCEVAQRLAGDGFDLRVDAIGFEVGGKARKELECIARAGHGYYYDAPDAAALVRQLARASGLSSHPYQFKGKRVRGGTDAASAPVLRPGQYLDDIGAGETRWYAVRLDGASAADLAATAVPQPGVAVAYGDGLDLKLADSTNYGFTCDQDDAHFQQDEGAMVVTGAVSRVPTHQGNGSCDKSGRYLLSVTRTSGKGSDRARWPVELRYGTERPLGGGVTAAPAATGYRAPAHPLGGTPRDVEGGTGFNDARTIGNGVWRDEVLPAQTRFYKVRLGWGQQLSYTVEYANEPVLDGADGYTRVDTDTFTPLRQPVPEGGEFESDRSYRGEPLSVGLGTVPVTWTNRWESGDAVIPVRIAGDYYIAVSLGPDAAKLAENAAVGVVLRVNVLGAELTGPQYRAAPVAKRPAASPGARDKAAGDAGGFPVVAVVGVGGVAALLCAAVAAVWVTRRRGARQGP